MTTFTKTLVLHTFLSLTILAPTCLIAQVTYFAGTASGTGNTGSYVTGIGYSAINSSNSGSYNSALGAYALSKNTTGTYNTGIGYAALYLNTTGGFNASVGGFALYSNNTGTSNNAFGYSALKTNTSGSYNTAIGREALTSNSTGVSNNAIGYFSLKSNTTGSYNTAIGTDALLSNTIGVNNIAIGNAALRGNISGQYNIAMGQNTQYSNTTGTYNIAVGALAMSSNTTGANNVALGYGALYLDNVDSANVAVGHFSMQNAYNSAKNVCVGANSFLLGIYKNCVGVGQSSGNGLTVTGGIVTSFDVNLTKCVLLGDSQFVRVSTPIRNAIAIGAGVDIDVSNKVKIGNNAVTSIGGQVGWTTYSDIRLKKNINKSLLGLDFILSLNPVNYNYKAEGQKDILYTGLIAQEVDEAAKKAGVPFSGVDKNGEMWGIRYGELTVPLIKGMQEMNTKMQIDNEALKARIEKLEAAIVAMQKGIPNAAAISTAVLFQNQPNPFNQQTNILYQLSTPDKEASIIIRNMNGSVVKQVKVAAGSNKITVNANELASGTYTYSLMVSGTVSDTKLMVITK